jgi:Zn-dependent peptidase ImmA (M78 family)
LTRRFPRLVEWEAGTALPTLKQLEAFAAATYTPLGYFFLPEPPAEAVPIPDFRTMGGLPVGEPSANLLDTIYICQQRQEWYRDYARASGEGPLPFVGSVAVGASVSETAAVIRRTIGIDVDARSRMGTWEEALRQFARQADAAGILVMANGVVQNNTHRPLDADEFSGFAIAEQLAPLVFVNAAESKSRQMFTLAHELVHVWLGQSALTDADVRAAAGPAVERWCNEVAAEVLVPIDAIRDAYRRGVNLTSEIKRLAGVFKVSTLVVLRRISDLGYLTGQAYWDAYDAELERLRELARTGSGGGNFYFTEKVRVGERFGRALVASTLEGRTLYRDAFRMLGFSKMETFHEFSQRLGMA